MNPDGSGSGVSPEGVARLVSAIHATETRAVLAVTGGGVAALSWLLGAPGASRTVLEATVPYAATALEQLIGSPPQQAVSAATAAHMAAACLRRAIALTLPIHPERTAPHGTSPLPSAESLSAESTSIRPYGPPTVPRDPSVTQSGGPATTDPTDPPHRPVPLIGVSATAALISDRPKRGDHRAHVGLAWLDGSAFGRPGPGDAVWSLRLAKGARDRTGEDGLVSALVIAVLAHGSGIGTTVPAPAITLLRAGLLPEDDIDPDWPI
ncbi:MAG: hypothetical protein ACKV2O_07035 [Acidimicrobiales bacterium]